MEYDCGVRVRVLAAWVRGQQLWYPQQNYLPHEQKQAVGVSVDDIVEEKAEDMAVGHHARRPEVLPEVSASRYGSTELALAHQIYVSRLPRLS